MSELNVELWDGRRTDLKLAPHDVPDRSFQLQSFEY